MAPFSLSRCRGRLCLSTDILAAAGQTSIEEKCLMLPNALKQKNYVRATHSAVFCEVRVDEAFGTVRVTRVVSAVAAGRIISAKTARRQIIDGVVWGISQALHEETYCDHTLGCFMNHNLSEGHGNLRWRFCADSQPHRPMQAVQFFRVQFKVFGQSLLAHGLVARRTQRADI